MRNSWGVWGPGVVMGAAIGVLWIGSARAADPAHLSWAKLLVDTVTPASNYYGDPAQVLWKGAGGLTYSTNRSKCASLVTQMLTRAYAPDMVGWFGCTSPHAAKYHDAIEVEDGFVLIESIAEVRAGDILAISYLDAGCEVLSCGSFTGCPSSGHVAIVAAAPTPRAATSPVIAGTAQYSLTIIDSSASYHGPADTRYQAEAGGANDQGVGRGAMRLYVDSVDPEHPVVGYSWSTSSGSTFYPHSARDLVIGRYVG